MATTIERLERLRNYGTLYEIELAGPDGQRFSLGCACKSRIALIQRVQARGRAIVNRLGLPEDVRFVVSGGRFPTVTIDGKYVVRFSGRTQRDAICGGELPAIV